MQLTNKNNLPSFMVKSINFWAGNHDSQADYSVTELIDSPRRVQLMRQFRDQITEDVSDRIWSLLGSATHKVVESALLADHDESLISERRMFATINGVKISGQFDVYDKSTQTIYDLKTASVWEIVRGVREEREKQLNCYSWLAKQEGLPVNGLAAVFILRDWSKSKAHEPDYPSSQVFVYPIRRWDDDEAEKYITGRIAAHESAKKLTPYCSPEEQWQRPEQFAVMGNGRKIAYRVLDTQQEAIQWINANKKGDFIEKRPGVSARCESYCSVRDFCTQYQVSKKAVK